MGHPRRTSCRLEPQKPAPPTVDGNNLACPHAPCQCHRCGTTPDTVPDVPLVDPQIQCWCQLGDGSDMQDFFHSKRGYMHVVPSAILRSGCQRGGALGERDGPARRKKCARLFPSTVPSKRHDGAWLCHVNGAAARCMGVWGGGEGWGRGGEYENTGLGDDTSIPTVEK